MGEQVPYNHQWDNVPLPDGEAAWQKMELLLEKRKKRRVLWWFLLATLSLMAGLLIGGWFWLNNGNKRKQPATSKEIIVFKDDFDTTSSPIKSLDAEQSKDTSGIKTKSAISFLDSAKRQQSSSGHRDHLPNSVTEKNGARGIIQHQIGKKEPIVTRKKKTLVHKTSTVQEDNIREPAILIQSNRRLKQKGKDIADSLSPEKDTIQKKDTTKTPALSPVTNDTTNKNLKKKLQVLTAGIGMQQFFLLPNQQASSYNYNGKRNSLLDHIPFLYVRWQRNEWYAQVEVAYGVPQPVKKFFYDETTQIDSAANTSHTERFSVQKLYYHHLAISVNRFILSNWSVGIGGQYNLLAGSVRATQTTDKKINTGEETTVEKIEPVRGGRDSLLVKYKDVIGLSLQTEYHWKRFSLGLRYTKNLQPFIKYTKPDGEIADDKNQTLQAILRFRVWR